MEGLTEQQKSVEDKFMQDWRQSPYYEFVMKVIDTELERSYVRDVVNQRTLDNQPMDDEEIGRQVRVEVQVNFRLRNGVRDVIA